MLFPFLTSMDCKESFSWVTVWGEGKTAMQFSVQFPERDSSLIMVDIASVQYKHSQKILELIETMLELQLPTKMSRSDIEKKLAQKILDTHILSFLMTNLIFQKGEFKWLIGLEKITLRMPDLLNTIELESLYSGPILFIGGANSDYIKPAYYTRIKKFFQRVMKRY